MRTGWFFCKKWICLKSAEAVVVAIIEKTQLSASQLITNQSVVISIQVRGQRHLMVNRSNGIHN